MSFGYPSKFYPFVQLLPLTAFVFDILENMCIYRLITLYPFDQLATPAGEANEDLQLLVNTASTLTLLKVYMIRATFAVCLPALIVLLVRLWRGDSKLKIKQK